jgi:hypothetical protein
MTTWTQFKEAITEKMVSLRKAARERMTGGFRQQIQRIKRKLRAQQQEGDNSAQRSVLLEKLQQLQDGRRTLRRRVLIAKHDWSAKATTKALYRRISTKFGDNTIKALVSKEGGPPRKEDDKANIMRDAWEEILNGGVENADRDAFIDRYRHKWAKVEMEELDDEITEEVVRAAITACKTGKACGPDDLGNEWY